MNVHKMTHMRISAAPLFIIGKKLETTQMFTNNETDKLWYIYSYSGIIDTHKWIAATYNTDECHRHDAEWNIISFIWNLRKGKTN